MTGKEKSAAADLPQRRLKCKKGASFMLAPIGEYKAGRKSYFRTARRRSRPRPTKADPKRAIVAGSGVVPGSV